MRGPVNRRTEHTPSNSVGARVLLIGVPGSVNEGFQRFLCGAGFAVETNDSAGHAVEGWATGFELVLVSLRPPALELPGVLRGWRAGGLSLPVLAVTEVRPALCLDAGADDCVRPTVAPEELAARLRALARRCGPPPAPLRVHDLVFDTGARRVERAGRAIPLTPREYDVLEFLAYRRGEMVPHETLRLQLFEGCAGPASNSVAVFIRRLRMKVDVGFDSPLIVTEWGRGYRLRASDG